jgi:hypothetical protein
MSWLFIPTVSAAATWLSTIYALTRDSVILLRSN